MLPAGAPWMRVCRWAMLLSLLKGHTYVGPEWAVHHGMMSKPT